MNSLRIDIAKLADLPELLMLYENARSYMATNGNPTQWGISGYPQKELLVCDIGSKQLFTVKSEGEILGAFVFIIGEEPTYCEIKNGEWLSDSPYGTIHRLAGLRGGLGVARACIEYCVDKCRSADCDLRADTHYDNTIMQHILENNGFVRCGIIHVADGSPRIAYQRAIRS